MTANPRIPLEQLATRLVELNLQYYRVVGKATVEYWRSLLSFATDQTPLKSMFDRAAAATQPTTANVRPAPAASASAAAAVLEAAAGEEAEGGFVVANRLSRHVTASFRISTFTDANGRVAAADVRVEPSTVSLAPGAQAIVQVKARIGDQLEIGTPYRGSISVPDLADAPIAVIVRRRAAAPEPAPEPPAPAAAAKRPAAARKRRKRRPGK